MAIIRWVPAAMLIVAAGSSSSGAPDAQPGDSPPDRAPARPSAPAVSKTVVLNTGARSECVTKSPEIREAYALLRAGRFAEGRAKLQFALDSPERNGVLKAVDRACLMNMVGFAELMQQHYELAVQWFERALELKPLPDDYRAIITSNAARGYFNLMQADRAEKLAREAIQLASRAFGPDSPDSLFPQTTLASVYVLRGDYASAEPVFRRVLARAEETWGPSSYQAAQAASNLGFTYFVERRYAAAQHVFEKALAGYEANPVRSKEDIPLVQTALSISCAGAGREREARMWVERALAYVQRELEPDHPSLAVIFERAAVTRFALKDYESGRHLFDRTIALLEARYGPGSSPVLDALGRYAVVLRSVKDKRRAKVVETRLRAFKPER